VQVPLVAFGTALADALEQQVTGVTLCFVSDAAAGMAADCVVNLILAAKLNTTTVHCIPNPAWMVQWALLSQQNVYSAAKLSRCLYALCRLEAAMSPPAPPSQTAVVGKDTRSKSCVQTVLFTIPMAVVPVLLPVLHDIFPDDRHVFAYTGCIQTVSTATAKTLGITTTTSARRQNKIATANNSSLMQALQFEHAVAFTTPINAAMQQQSVHTMEPYVRALADLPVDVAAVTECWMAAVDAYLTRKLQVVADGASAATTSDYLPYVCKIDHVVQQGPPTKGSSVAVLGDAVAVAVRDGVCQSRSADRNHGRGV
jgi:hypothetical protein